tara:strand:- start:590 stop:847 length:258 start_codon:yes stop_codon:yes gene_type:complete
MEKATEVNVNHEISKVLTVLKERKLEVVQRLFPDSAHHQHRWHNYYAWEFWVRLDPANQDKVRGYANENRSEHWWNVETKSWQTI